MLAEAGELEFKSVDALPRVVELGLKRSDALSRHHRFRLRCDPHAVGLRELHEHLGGLVRIGLAARPEALDFGLQGGHAAARSHGGWNVGWPERHLVGGGWWCAV